MKTKRFFMALPAMAALLLTVSCNNQEFETNEDSKTHTVPFSATVNQGVQTRASLNTDGDAYVFQAGDKLYVYDDFTTPTVTGTLTLAAGSEGKTTGATFTGSLSYTGSKPSSTTSLVAVLKGVNDELLPARAAAFNGTVTFPETAIASSPAEAVEKYSFFKTSTPTTFENPSFTLDQMSSFIDFNITLTDGTAADTELGVTINNSGSVVRTGTVTTVEESEAIKAKFTAAFMGTMLNGATVKLGTKSPISFGGSESKTLAANKIYRVSKTIEPTTMDKAFVMGNTTVISYYVQGKTVTLSSTFNGTGFETTTAGGDGANNIKNPSMTKDGDKLVISVTMTYSSYSVPGNMTIDTPNNTYYWSNDFVGNWITLTGITISGDNVYPLPTKTSAI